MERESEMTTPVIVDFIPHYSKMPHEVRRLYREASELEQCAHIILVDAQRKRKKAQDIIDGILWSKS